MNELILRFGLENVQMIPPVTVCLLLVYFLVRYVRQYRRPARKVIKELQGLSVQVAGLKAERSETRLRKLKEVFGGASERVQRAWAEYEETLHAQHELVDGEARLVRVRATVQSSVYFGTQNLVETPLQAEYFRHLPGIATGIGIIGTFAGLLIGLFYFDASDPARIQGSVSVLLSGVRDAFVASALAISAAMYITNSEKKHLRLCYEALESLTEGIDALFEAGVGEEYLAALVKSSEESARQARQLKDGLVSDLREMLQNLVDSQVRENLKLAETLGSVYRESGNNIASSISGSIEQSFREPLQQIANSVNTATGTRTGEVQGLLQDVLMAFMNKLDASFGQQFNGMHEMMGQSVAAMQQMQGAFQTLVSDMRAASERSGEAMNEQLGRAMADMAAGQSVMQAGMNEMIANLQQAVSSIGSRGEEAGSRMAEQLERLFAESEARQRGMAENLEKFVDSMRLMVGRGQKDMLEEIGHTVSQLGVQLGSVMQTLEASREGMSAGAASAQQTLQDGAQGLVEQLGGQVEKLLAGLGEQQQGVSSAVAQLDAATRGAIEGVKDGADRMKLAADRFGAAGDSALRLVDASGTSARMWGESGAVVSAATRELATQVAAYQQHREAVQRMLASLEGVVAGSQNEANARAKMVGELNQVVAQMQQVNAEAARYLEQVNAVLGSSFASFGEGVEKSLQRTLGTLDQELHKAVGQLAGGVQDLGESMEELSDVLGKARH